MLWYIILYYIMVYYIILWYIILYYGILYYIMVYYIILSYVIFYIDMFYVLYFMLYLLSIISKVNSWQRQKQWPFKAGIGLPVFLQLIAIVPISVKLFFLLHAATLSLRMISSFC